jgi:nitroimidazol reductase NimA-like FMN-containing flavoprotein (pyridoxamine 5'-phosphate oxidase superfamily)
MSPDPAPSPASPPARSVRLTPDEAWGVVEASHTGILATLRRDGVPIMLPLWFVVIDRRIYLRTGADSKKARRIRHDPRASFLVEAGERWAELSAVHLTGTVTALEEGSPLISQVEAAFDAKYAGFRTASSKMSDATRAYYARPRGFFCFRPDERILSWDNARLGLS